MALEVPSREPEIARELAGLAGSLDILEAALGDIEKRLEPIMSPAVSAPEGVPPKAGLPPHTTAIGTRLGSLTLRVDRSTERLREVAHRIEI